MADIVKQGYVKVKSKNLGKWNRRWLILRRSDGGRSARLEKYESESAAGFQASAHCAVYDLADATVQLPRDKPATIYILLNDLSSVHIATDFEPEAESWKSAIEQAISGHGGNEAFEVYLMPSASLKSSGACLLQVNSDSVQLLDVENSRRVQLTWPFSTIRRYDVERGMFSLEAGRKSPTGEGVFLFETKDPEAIFDLVQRATRAFTRSRDGDAAERRNTVPGNCDAYERWTHQ